MGTEEASQNRPTAAQYADEVKARLGEDWLPRIYAETILTTRTRSYHLDLPVRRSQVDVQHTLLGVELKIGSRRSLCPDLATARYLAVFARAGCSDVAVPYDITRISGRADALESSWQRMLLLVEHIGSARSIAVKARTRSLLVEEIRTEIKRLGAGTPIPQFKQSTKQRTK
jgi:hypothetical protein